MTWAYLENADGLACFYCTVTDWAFGPVAQGDILEHFAQWLGRDPRSFTDGDLAELWGTYARGSHCQWCGEWIDPSMEIHEQVYLHGHGCVQPSWTPDLKQPETAA